MNKKLVTLKRNKEFNYVYRKGKSLFTPHLTLIYNMNRYGGLRYGFSVSKKIGNAVTRNKVRRRLKNINQDLLKDLETEVNANLVFVAKKDIQNISYEELSAEVVHLLRKAKIL